MVIREIILEGRALHCIYCTADKKPIGPNGWYSAVADAAAITRLQWGPLFGVPTGRINGIVIVDIDPRNNGDETFEAELAWLPPTLTHRTKSGGKHLIYKYPPQGIGNLSGSKGRLAGIDILSDGAVWPPSPGYTVIDDRPMAECPERLRELVAIAKTEEGASSPLPHGREAQASGGGVQRTRHVGMRTQNILAVVMNAGPGDGRNGKLYWASRRFGELIAEGLVPRECAEIMLLSVARYNGHVAKRGLYQTKATIASGLDHQVCGPGGEGEDAPFQFSPSTQERDHE
jgi:hypothetical protein